MNATNTTYQDIEKTTVSPAVLRKIVLLTTLSVDGVSRMASSKSIESRLFNRQDLQGAKVQVKDGEAFVDVFVVLMNNMNVRDISREIQSRVSRAISEMLGMEVGGVNVHIMNIDFSA